MNEKHPLHHDGLVVEDAHGNRLLAIPTSVLEILKYAAVVQFIDGERVCRMRVDGWQPGQPRPIASTALTALPAPPSDSDTAVPGWKCPNVDCGANVADDELVCAWCSTRRPNH